MGIIKQGILGAFSNKVGSVVGTTWKGIAIMKSRPASVANPRTSAQTENRDRFKACTTFASTINAATIKPLWDRFAVKQSGYNAFVSANVSNFNVLGIVNPSLLVMSKGKIAQTPITVTANKGSNTITFDWTIDSGEGFKNGSDKVFMLVYNNTRKLWIQSGETSFTRGDGSSDMELPETWLTGDQVYGYLSFMRADGTMVSVSAVDSASITA